MAPLGENYEWRALGDFRPGDRVHRWGDDLLVSQAVTAEGMTTMTYEDEGRTKTLTASAGSEYIARKRAQE